MQNLQNAPFLTQQVPAIDTGALFSPPPRESLESSHTVEETQQQIVIPAFTADQFQSPPPKAQQDSDAIIIQEEPAAAVPQEEAKAETFDDFKQIFLNNHISTIEEDFDGENVASEFSLTQRTNQKAPPNGEVDPAMLTPSIDRNAISLTSYSQTPKNKPPCQDTIDFGTVFLDRPTCISIQALTGTTFESDLRGIVYFADNLQEARVTESSMLVWLKANRLGRQEKYITALN